MSHASLFEQEWQESNSKYLELMDSSDPVQHETVFTNTGSITS